MKYYSNVFHGSGFLVRDKEDGSSTQAYSVDRDIWVDDAELGSWAKDRRQGDFCTVDSEAEVREIMESMKNPTPVAWVDELFAEVFGTDSAEAAADPKGDQ